MTKDSVQDLSLTGPRTSRAVLRNLKAAEWSALAPDGRTCVTFQAQAMSFWDLESARRTVTLALSSGVVARTYDPRGSLFALATGDLKIRVYSIARPQSPPMIFTMSSLPTQLEFSMDGKALLANCKSGVYACYLAPKPAIITCSDRNDPATFADRSGNSILIANAQGVAAYTCSPSGVRLTSTLTGRDANAVAVHPTSEMTALALRDGTIELQSASQSQLLPGSDWIGHLKFSNDGSQLLRLSDGSKLALWDTHLARQIGPEARIADVIASFSLSPDGSRITAIAGEKPYLFSAWRRDLDPDAMRGETADFLSLM